MKGYNEINKYKYLEIEIQKTSNLKTIIILIMCGALYMIEKGIDKQSSCSLEIKTITPCGTIHLPTRKLSQ